MEINMAEPVVYLAYSPRGPGLMCAVYYLRQGNDNVCGWFSGAQGNDFPAQFFMLENYYTQLQSQFYLSLHDDVYSGWMRLLPKPVIELEKGGPLPLDYGHELEKIQDRFVREWLFFESDEERENETAAYRKMELAVKAVNVKTRKLNKFDTGDVVWTYTGAGFDLGVIKYLRQHWQLDY
jgi:hypothetical protein